MKTLALCCFVALCAPLAQADVFNFFCITGNNAADCATGVAQLSVNVTDAGGGQVLFTFTNAGPNASSIADVYFDDGTLLGIASIINSTGVSFSQGAAPPNLPGGNGIDPPFQTTAGFLADSNPPVQPNGVNPGESLGILFNLINGTTYADTIAALTGPIGVGHDLRIGIHVQGFAGGGSESFINNPGGSTGPQAVPEPSSVFLLGTTLIGVCGLLRKRIAARKA